MSIRSMLKSIGETLAKLPARQLPPDPVAPITVTTIDETKPKTRWWNTPRRLRVLFYPSGDVMRTEVRRRGRTVKKHIGAPVPMHRAVRFRDGSRLWYWSDGSLRRRRT